MDTKLRDAERSGDRVAWLTERMRAGTLSRDAVELAAYCGDPAARKIKGWSLYDPSPDTWCPCEGFGELCEDDACAADACSHGAGGCPVYPCGCGSLDLADFVAGLARFNGALERAALAACEVWRSALLEQHMETECVGPDVGPDVYACCRAPGKALQAARAHIEAPSEATREACATMWATSSLDLPTTRLCGGLDGVHSPSWPAVVVTEAARLSAPAAVRAGICAALIEWALA